MSNAKPDTSWLKTLSIGFSIISFGITIAIVGYFVLTTKQNQNVAQPSPTPTINETVSLNVFESNNYSFKYPYDWKIVKIGNEEQRLFPPGVSTEGVSWRIWIHTSEKSYGVDVSSAIGTKKEIAHNVFERKTDEVLIHNIKGAKVENDVLPDSQTDGLNRNGVKIPFNKKILYIQLICGDAEKDKQFCEQYKPVFDQILSTFRFTE